MVIDETYSDEQREEVRARLQRFQDKQKAINDQTRILKGRYSNQIYQIRESITKFLDKETGTLGESIRTLFKEQGVTIVSILKALVIAYAVDPIVEESSLDNWVYGVGYFEDDPWSSY